VLSVAVVVAVVVVVDWW